MDYRTKASLVFRVFDCHLSDFAFAFHSIESASFLAGGCGNSMEISNDVRTILDRCRVMNCIYEGQSFSGKSFSGAFPEPERGEAAVDEMIGSGLVVKNVTGAYSLTSAGAATLKSAAAAHKQQAFPRRQMQSRPPINKV